MTRKLFATTLAVALAGGVYFAAQPAQASNMGFKLERDFTSVPGLQNFYFVSFPLFNGLGDVANSGNSNPCDISTSGGDSIINSHDAICDMWSGEGVFTMSRLNTETCFLEPETLQTFLGSVVATNTWTDPLDATEAFQVNVPLPTGTSTPIQNPAVIVGSHDPSFAGTSVALGASGCNRLLINLPYHTMYQTSAEVLCGLEGVDWTDGDGDGLPDDTCDGGIFDGNAKVSVLTFDNEDNGEVTDNTFVPLSVEFNPLVGLIFTGQNFDLRPGDGYVVIMTNSHTATTWLSPHF